jgi:acetyl-CoA C-acetyltransferase
MTASIVGWAHTPFGKFDTETVESLVVKVVIDALADAGISAGDVDEIVLGISTPARRGISASLVLGDPQLQFKPATGSRMPARRFAAVHRGTSGHRGRCCRIVLVVGVEQMTRRPPAEIGRNLRAYLPEDGDTGFAGVFGKSHRPISEIRRSVRRWR